MKKGFLKKLVQAYLSGTASPSERQLLEACLSELETNAVNNQTLTNEENLKQDMWLHIQAHTIQPEDAPIVRLPLYQKLGFRIAAACSILLFVAGTLFFTSNKPQSPLNATVKTDTTSAPHTALYREKNTSGASRMFRLPDSSLIVLADQSEIAYQEPFTGKRYLFLNGKCLFKVAKNKAKPFTVESGAVTTTALGTEFLITAYNNTGWLTVRLNEGKVVIQPMRRSDKQMTQDYYLQPGQEFVYSNKALARVRNFREQKGSTAVLQNGDTYPDDPAFSEKNDGSWYMFNNQSLANVLNDLAALYNVKIIYNRKDVEKIYFTGKYDKSKPLETILYRIGKLNNLNIRRTDTAFIIRK